MQDRLPENARELPIHGVVGVLSGTLETIGGRDLLENCRGLGLGGIEIRADLFADPRTALDLIPTCRSCAPVLFTARRSSEGGLYDGLEGARIDLYRSAIRRGASMVDAEWGTEASEVLSRDSAPLLVSHHDFQRMPPRSELDRLALEMETCRGLAIKIVPTAKKFSDSLEILKWLEGRRPGSFPCASFAMGDSGLASRILSISRGSLLTYASLGSAVAPGQMSVLEILSLYRPCAIRASTRAIGIVGFNPFASLVASALNLSFFKRGVDAVSIPVERLFLEEIQAAMESSIFTEKILTDPVHPTAAYLSDLFRALTSLPATPADFEGHLEAARRLLQLRD